MLVLYSGFKSKGFLLGLKSNEHVAYLTDEGVISNL